MSFFRIERQLSFLEKYQNIILSFICDIFGCPIFVCFVDNFVKRYEKKYVVL